MKDNITEEIETFNLDIDLPPSADNRISIQGITTVVGGIIDESSKQFIHATVSKIIYMHVVLFVEFERSVYWQ